jgi:hypothetical protein
MRYSSGLGACIPGCACLFGYHSSGETRTTFLRSRCGFEVRAGRAGQGRLKAAWKGCLDGQQERARNIRVRAMMGRRELVGCGNDRHIVSFTVTASGCRREYPRKGRDIVALVGAEAAEAASVAGRSNLPPVKHPGVRLAAILSDGCGLIGPDASSQQ